MEKFEANAILGIFTLSIGGWLAEMGVLGYLLLIFAIAMILDYVSGIVASKKESIEHPNSKKYGWSSKKGMLGIIKKFGYILIVFTTILIDFMIYKIAGVINVTMPIKTFFSTLVTIWFILNETLSIIENAGRMGCVNIPPFIAKLICALKKQVENEADAAVEKIEIKDGAENE